jgi:predicted MFS family arabinose efflux permease
MTTPRSDPGSENLPGESGHAMQQPASLPAQESVQSPSTPFESTLQKLSARATLFGPLAGTAQGILRVASVFTRPYFANLWLGMLLSNIGTWVYVVSLQWKVHQVKNDPRWLGYCAMATWTAGIVTTPIGGVLADRLDCRKIMITINAALLFLSALLAALSWGDLLSGPVFLIAASLAGVCNALYNPSSQTLLPRIVGQEHISSAVALNAIQFNTSRAIGPAIGGSILAVWGAAAGFLVNSLSFLAPVLALCFVPKHLGAPHPGTPLHPLRALANALSYAKSRPTVIFVLVTVFFAAFCVSPFMNLLPAYIKQCYDNTPGQYSTLLSMFGLGAIVGVPLIASRVKGSSPNPWLSLPLLACFALVALGLSAAPAFYVTRMLAFCAGLFFIGAANRVLSFMISGSPPELRGRVASLHFMVFSLGVPLGSWLWGYLASTQGMRTVFFADGCLMLACVITLSLLAKSLIRQSLSIPAA